MRWMRDRWRHDIKARCILINIWELQLLGHWVMLLLDEFPCQFRCMLLGWVFSRSRDHKSIWYIVNRDTSISVFKDMLERLYLSRFRGGDSDGVEGWVGESFVSWICGNEFLMFGCDSRSRFSLGEEWEGWGCMDGVPAEDCSWHCLFWSLRDWCVNFIVD